MGSSENTAGTPGSIALDWVALDSAGLGWLDLDRFDLLTDLLSTVLPRSSTADFPVFLELRTAFIQAVAQIGDWAAIVAACANLSLLRGRIASRPHIRAGTRAAAASIAVPAQGLRTMRSMLARGIGSAESSAW
ncbi:MAG TPA: hypothetical protein VK325_06165 [Pseudoxanthomonas sp.]|nr:hypothetical protein [Pseudoxanthomonas sp.]